MSVEFESIIVVHKSVISRDVKHTLDALRCNPPEELNVLRCVKSLHIVLRGNVRSEDLEIRPYRF